MRARGRTTWYAADNTTEQGQQAYLVVMNPFGTDAVFDVVLYAADAAPDPRLRPAPTSPLGRAGASRCRLNDKSRPARAAVAAEVVVTAGRVAVASLGIDASGGVRSALGVAGHARRRPTCRWRGGAGQSQLARRRSPGRESVRFGGHAVLRRTRRSRPAVSSASRRTRRRRSVYPVITAGPVGGRRHAQDGDPFVAALRATGPGNDAGATARRRGAGATVGRAADRRRASRLDPGLVLVNPGSEPVAGRRCICSPTAGAAAAADVTVTVPAAIGRGACRRVPRVGARRGRPGHRPDGAPRSRAGRLDVARAKGSPVYALAHGRAGAAARRRA